MLLRGVQLFGVGVFFAFVLNLLQVRRQIQQFYEVLSFIGESRKSLSYLSTGGARPTTPPGEA